MKSQISGQPTLAGTLSWVRVKTLLLVFAGRLLVTRLRKGPGVRMLFGTVHLVPAPTPYTAEPRFGRRARSTALFSVSGCWGRERSFWLGVNDQLERISG